MLFLEEFRVVFSLIFFPPLINFMMCVNKGWYLLFFFLLLRLYLMVEDCVLKTSSQE